MLALAGSRLDKKHVVCLAVHSVQQLLRDRDTFYGKAAYFHPRRSVSLSHRGGEWRVMIGGLIGVLRC